MLPPYCPITPDIGVQGVFITFFAPQIVTEHILGANYMYFEGLSTYFGDEILRLVDVSLLYFLLESPIWCGNTLIKVSRSQVYPIGDSLTFYGS